ncbi:MAG: hypothetical protein KatS3mg019_0243 [Fimbriimonadales bacterium]|nr:MAG: hypothetical protein KatS3mg019_0243 [Fimbriimonadales bacterium]
MTRLLYFGLAAILSVVLTSCGGGGGSLGPSALLQGRVVLVSTGQPPNPPATVIVGGQSVNTNTQEGAFQLRAPIDARQLTVRTPGLPDFTFNLPPLQAGQTVDLGDLYVGVQTISVQGRIVDALTQQAVGDAVVTLLGQRALSNPTTGRFTLNSVAYDPEGVLDPEGEVQKSGYIPRRFLADAPVIDGVMDVGDILLLSQVDDNPPGQPGNVRGVAQVPLSDAVGVRIDIYTPPSAPTPIDSVILSQPSGAFQLWLLPAQYRLVFTKGTRTAERTVNVTSLTAQVDLGTVSLQ